MLANISVGQTGVTAVLQETNEKLKGLCAP